MIAVHYKKFMKETVIIGQGGLAREIAQYINDINVIQSQLQFIGFVSRDKNEVGSQIGDSVICLCDQELVDIGKELNVIIGIGFPDIVYRLATRLVSFPNLSFPNIHHPRSYKSDSVLVGRGNIFAPGVVVSVDVEIGSFNLFDWNVTLGHDSVVGNNNVFLPSCNISGSIKIGSGVLVGAGAQILPGLSICDHTVIGAGAVVTKDILEPGTYMGIPARKYDKGR